MATESASERASQEQAERAKRPLNERTANTRLLHARAIGQLQPEQQVNLDQSASPVLVAPSLELT